MTRVRYFDHQFASVHEIKVMSPRLAAIKRHSWVGFIFIFAAIILGGANV